MAFAAALYAFDEIGIRKPSPPCFSSTSTVTPFGAMALICFVKSFAMVFESWFGTRRIEIFACASLGMTVFDPSPM